MPKVLISHCNTIQMSPSWIKAYRMKWQTTGYFGYDSSNRNLKGRMLPLRFLLLLSNTTEVQWDLTGIWAVNPATPGIVMLWWEQGIHWICTGRSETSEVEAESSNVRSLMSLFNADTKCLCFLATLHFAGTFNCDLVYFVDHTFIY